MAIQFALFDVGNVCYPYSLDPLNLYCLNKTCRVAEFKAKAGIKSFDYNPFMRGEISFREFCYKLCDYAYIEFKEQYIKEIDYAMHQGVGDFYKETLLAMEFLQNIGIEIGLLSNALPNLSDTAPSFIKCENIFTSYQLGLLKPQTAIFQKVLESLHLNADEVLFIDDKKKNIDAAISIKMRGVVFNEKTILSDIQKNLF